MKLDATDGLLVIGIACIVYGIALIFVPAAWIAAGVFIIAFAFLIAKERANASSTKSGSE